MSKYRLSCNLRSLKHWDKVFPIVVIDKHPDLCKQKIESMHPRHQMENIRIEDLTPVASSWDSKPQSANKVTASKSLDLDSTWKKELLK